MNAAIVVSTGLGVFAGLCAFAIAGRGSRWLWLSVSKALFRRSQRWRVLLGASLASDQELARWLGREADELRESVR